jgi:phospholipase C
MRCALLVVLISGLGLTSCAGNSAGTAGGLGLPKTLSRASGSGSSSYIQHVVVVIQENRTFDNLFATFPGADGATQGLMKVGSGSVYVPLQEVGLAYPCDFGHSYNGFLKDYDGGKMDGFNTEGGGKKCPGQAGTKPYQYVAPENIVPYWEMAQQYVLADHMFQTQGSGSFEAHQDFIAGGTTINPAKTKTVIDFPSKKPWGCDAPKHTVTTVLVAVGSRLARRYHKGPRPCFQYETLRDLMDAKYVSWRYFSPPEPHGAGALWNAFDAIYAVRNGPEWKTNISVPQTNIFADITYGTLANVSWVVPAEAESDHPGNVYDNGPSWVASVVNAIGESQYWANTAIVVVWDDWGGFYDHEPPPFFDEWGGLGFRVPMIVISAYAPQAGSSQTYISHTQYEFGSIVKFIEDTWSLGSLGTTDVRANSIIDCFDFTQQPRPFNPIASQYSKEYFLHHHSPYQPVDSE